METVAHLEQALYEYQTNPPSDELRIKAWRFALVDQTVVKAGIRNNKLGEVYAAPTYTDTSDGDLLIVWEDGLCSHAEVNQAVVSNISAKMRLWRQSAYEDPAGAVLLDPEPLPLAALEQQAVKDLVEKDPKWLFELLYRYQSELPKLGIQTIQAGVQAGCGLRHIRTSKGLSVSYEQTAFSTYISADGLYGRSFAKRRLPLEAEIAEMIQSTGKVVSRLKKEAKFEAGMMTVVLVPELVESFVGKYLHSNLSGNSVVNKQAAYTLEDFKQAKPVFDPRINLYINPLKPFELSSYLCTREGLPASKQYLVKGGKLLTPYLTVKDSIKSGLKPTPLPIIGGIWLEVGGQKSFEQMISEIENGILVINVLGMHTQDAISGSYSLSAPQCLKIEKGKLRGSVKTVITGNFLEHLTDATAEYAEVIGFDLPAMKFTANVTRA